MAYGTGFDPNSPAAPKWGTASGVKPLTESPINAARAWARADETGIFDNAHRASLTTTDPTQQRSLGGANAARGKIRGSRAMARPSITQGQALGGPPEEPDRRGDAGPSAYAQGVAPNFYRDKPYYDQPFGATGKTVSNLAKLLTLVRRDGEEEQPEEEAPPETPPELGPGPERPELGPAPERPQLGPGSRTPAPYQGGSPDIYEPPVDAEIQDEIGTTYPAIGRGIIDVDSWETAGEIGGGTPIVGPGSAGEIGRGNRSPGIDRRAQRAIGPGPRALNAGDPNAGPSPRLGPPEGFAMGGGGVTPADPSGRTISRRGRGAYGFRPMEELDSRQQQVEEAAASYEFGNAYLGQSAGRRATRGERNARKTEDQGQIPGFGWEDV